MNMQNKKIFSTLLMIVGAVFVIISGCIFVTATWQFLPEIVKKLSLSLITIFFFTISCIAGNKFALKKTSLAFFYLACCFLGFSVYSLLGMLNLGLYLKLALSELAAAIPIVIYFCIRKNFIDCILSIALADAILYCICFHTQTKDFNGYFSGFCALLFLLAVLIRYFRIHLPEHKDLLLTSIVAYLLHGLLAFPYSFFFSLMNEGFLYSLLPAAFVTASVTVIYITFPIKPLRLFQSITLLGFPYCICLFVTDTFGRGFLIDRNLEVNSTTLLLTFIINLGIMLAMKRKEMLFANCIFATFFTLIQLLYFMLCGGFFTTSIHKPYYPFALCLAVAFPFWKLFVKPDMEWIKVCKLSGIWLLMAIVAGISSKNLHFVDCYSLSFYVALVLALFSTIFCKNKIAQSILRSIALVFLVLPLFFNPLLPTKFYISNGETLFADFTVEHACILGAIIIVLLRFIWYHMRERIRLTQFIVSCVLLFVLLCNNIALESLPNVLFLGIVTFVMLLFAVALNQKKYAISSSLTLMLVALYLTRSFWLSIAWWVYLFIAGMGMILYAVIREKKEKKQ